MDECGHELSTAVCFCAEISTGITCLYDHSYMTVYIGLLQPHCERVAIEALQLCTLLLPPACRRKLQLLMRMMSRISQNVDMPRLHPAIGTRTLVRSKPVVTNILLELTSNINLDLLYC